MARLNCIEIKAELRPCIVNGERKALFHKWFEKRAVLRGQTSEELSNLFGVVEYEDGQIGFVEPHSIRFVDNKTAKYAFTQEVT